MTYYEITLKLKDLTMAPADWQWLYGYCKSKHGDDPNTYMKILDAYKVRKAGRQPMCDTGFGGCKYCGHEFVCGYRGFCSHQKTTLL